MLGVCGAGRAGEEIIYGGDEVSTINQRRLVLARRIVTKLVVSNAMSDTPELADRMISHPVRHGERSLRQVILRKVGPSPLGRILPGLPILFHLLCAPARAALPLLGQTNNACIMPLVADMKKAATQLTASSIRKAWESECYLLVDGIMQCNSV